MACTIWSEAKADEKQFQPDARSKVGHRPAEYDYVDRHHPKHQVVATENGMFAGLPVGQPDSDPDRSDTAKTALSSLRRKRQGFLFENSTYGGQRMLVRGNLAAHDPYPSDAETVHSAGLRSPKSLSLPQRNNQTTLKPDTKNDEIDREISDASSSIYSETSYASEASLQTVRPRQVRQTAQSVSNENPDSIRLRSLDNASLSPQNSQNPGAGDISLQAALAQNATHKTHWIQKGLRPSVVSEISVYSSPAHTSEDEEEL